jgi:hypothetical protein
LEFGVDKALHSSSHNGKGRDRVDSVVAVQ